jgi:hypothetical protein
MKVKLQNVRLSFPDLFTAVQYEGQGALQLPASFLFPKTGHPALAAIDELR